MTKSNGASTNGDAVTATLLRLADRLRARGLRVGVSHSTASLEATNPATGGRQVDCRFPPQPLQQRVSLAARDDQLWVWWLWPDSVTGSYEREPLLPATELERAADKIADVVALAPIPSGTRS